MPDVIAPSRPLPDAARPPRGVYAVVVVVTGLLALGAALLMARVLDQPTSEATRLVVLIALGAGVLVSFAPVVIRGGGESWGLIVLATSMVRAMLVMGGAAGLTMMANRPIRDETLWLPLVVGLVIFLVIESGAAVYLLSRMDKARRAFAASQSVPGVGTLSGSVHS